jgi:5-methyltetrahydrofolate--homocysteine methyltransferase
MNKFLSTLTSKKVLLCDGAMGTELQRRGLKVGDCPEEYNLTHPEMIQAIHKDYYDAGSDIVETNTFGASQLRLKFYGLDNKVRDINLAAVNNAKAVCPKNKFIAGSIGPLGELLEPIGTISEKFAYEVFGEQAKILEEGGVDILFIETMMAIEEAVIAVKAAKENTSLPVAASMTFELGKTGLKTPWGVDVQTAVKELTNTGADIIGSNCGKGFDEMLKVINEMKKLTTKPILAQSNAGIPELVDGNLHYVETPEMIAPKVNELLKSGVNIIGGCCGTNPSHIKKMRETLDLFLTNTI